MERERERHEENSLQIDKHGGSGEILHGDIPQIAEKIRLIANAHRAKAALKGKNLGCIGEAKMEDGCVLLHCRYDRRGDPCDRYIRTSLVQSWKKDKETGRIVVETMNSIYQLDPVKVN